MKNTNNMNKNMLLPVKILLLIVISMIIGSCTTNIAMPKQPSKSNRVPVNKTIPVELEG